MRDYSKVNPKFWIDDKGIEWRVPTIKGRLKSRIPGHRALRDFIIRRDGGVCRQCGTAANLVADHILSRRNGGSHHPENLQCLCSPCNSRKAVLVDAKEVSHGPY